MKEFDYIIIGGGCAGLSLAYELDLNSKLKDKTLAIVEPRDEYIRDKTWSFWKVSSHNFEDCVKKSWDNFSINIPNDTKFIDCKLTPYQSIDSGKFYDKKNRLEINQWLMAQMGYVGPMLGQHHQFHHYNPGKSKFGEERYFKIAERIYTELDQRLSNSKFLSGDDYTIADIGTFPWIARHEWHDIGLSNYKNLTRWYNDISTREAVIKGFSFMNKNEVVPKP